MRRPDSGDQRPPRELQPRVARREGEAPILAAEWAGRWLESGDIRGASGAGAVVLPSDRYTTVSCSITPPLPRSSALLPRRLRILPELCDRLGLQREGKPKPLSWGRAILLPRARWNGCNQCNAACVSFLPLPTSPFAWHGDPCTLLPSDYCRHSYRRLQAYCSASSSSLCGSGTSHRMQLNNSKRGGF